MNGKEFEKKVFKLQAIIDKNRDEIEKLKSELQNISTHFDKKRIFKRIELIDKFKYALRQCKGCEYWLDHDLECFCLFCNNCLKKGGVIKHRKGSAYPLCQKCFEKEQKNKLKKEG